ncbi:ABC transporter ATP-binding protein [Engelhardtia mirabilis]|uniref:Putative multidrug resistance ABC transporter ATP-binding/permease protein YheH n=1 Tax=Engelhardtia mirabilis TaxID=2528011 RepID=A0A518BIM0_9BACT|nr:putative multidrug resistance ABC transporter ATP-binding/permease protein YheH [Planctomycetes bacterium Pla133]QDV01142.1 putative multidrug resistance ABC transporter ATP-binding/permease protein YheH [Planctomycetes bacterium Pla86]
MTDEILDDEHSGAAARIDWGLWKRLLAYSKRYPRTLGIFVTAAIVVGAADTGIPLVTRGAIDAVTAAPPEIDTFELLWPYALAYAGVSLALAGGVFTFIRCAGILRPRIARDIRRDAYANLQRLSLRFYDRRPSGWLVARMTSDCERLSNILAWGVLDVVWGATVMSGIATAMLFLEWRLALAVLVFVPLLAWISLWFQRRILQSSRAVRGVNSRITAAYAEDLAGVATTMGFAREREQHADFAQLTERMAQHSIANALQAAVYLPVVLTIGSLALALALGLGGQHVAVGALSLGTLIAFMTYARQFFEPVQQVAARFAELLMAQAAAERILGLIDEVPEIGDSDEVRAILAAGEGRARPAGFAADGLPDRIGQIRFEHVSFHYDAGEPVLADFNLTVEPGQTIALVGETGGGKSTIAGLLCRFYEPTAGEILFDGVDYRQRGLAWLRSKLAIVLQTPHLFSGSVLDNVRYGRLDATEEDVRAALRLVGAQTFVDKLEKGLDTRVGEGGARLSTGQKQLISFARALVAEPEILILDEATSSVDTQTERAVQRALETVLHGRTSFVIAHRLSTVRSADRILVIGAGRILEQGNHQELLALRGRYHELYTGQSLVADGERKAAWEAVR